MIENSKKTIIIAEAGVNHNGDLKIAKELIEAAVSAGADYVKFQTFAANKLVTSTAPKAKYQIENILVDETQHDMLSKLELSKEAHFELKEHAIDNGIEFLSTAFDLESLDFLKQLGLPIFKIPSGEITNYPYLQKVGSFGTPLILSTGMSSLSEIHEALEVLKSAGTPQNLVTVLHCTTSYPVPMTDVNLQAMITIKNKLNVSVGYSDHTNGIEVPVAAVALGAKLIEKHFTLDRNLPGPDHKASLEPHELKDMVSAIRNIEHALGDGDKSLQESEVENRTVVRKSIVALTSIKKGDIFTEKNLTTKRPNSGMSAMKWPEVIGKISRYDFKPDEFIKL